MARKIWVLVPIIAVVVILGLSVIESTSIDRSVMEETFEVDAIYYEDKGYAEIIFEDKSQKTKSVILEILGMSNSFQKTYSQSSFLEQVPFSTPPKYGWKTTPVTLSIEHEELGKIGIKTEIHLENEAPKPIIYSRP